MSPVDDHIRAFQHTLEYNRARPEYLLAVSSSSKERTVRDDYSLVKETTKSPMRSRPEVISKIYEAIETIEQELQQVKELLNQVTKEESTDDEIIVEAEFVEEERKPEAKPTKSLGKKESKRLSKTKFIEAKWRAQNWAIQEEQRKKKEKQMQELVRQIIIQELDKKEVLPTSKKQRK